MADGELSTFDLHKKRNLRAWTIRSAWDKLYNDAYEFAIPQRRPGGQTRSKTQIDRLFDMRAIISTFHFAGQLQRDLFPAGQPSFNLVPGAWVKARLPADQVRVLGRELETISNVVHPFFLTGEWDQAIHETCLDLAIGTGGLFVAKGTPHQPLRFMSIPSEELAVELGSYGDVIGVFWKQKLPRTAIKAQFSSGRFPDEFEKQLREDPYGEITLYQDFYLLPNVGRWQFVAWIDDSKDFIASNTFRTRPIAVPRYYRVPGEAYGRGPVLLALPSIKTLNKAQEFALKAAAIQMLGIWGYRAGGTFNPDTVRVGPGEFWPMMATGGVLGADVQRLDPAAGRLDVTRLVTEGLSSQISDVLLDNRLPEPGGTPPSASEVVGRLRQKADAHLGAFGRLSREIMPVVVPRAMEILFEFGYLSSLPSIDELLVALEVRSPMAQALKADQLTPIVNYFEVVVATAGARALPVYLHLERSLDLIADETQVPMDVRPTEEERKQARDRIATQEAAEAAIALAAAGGGAPAEAAEAPA